MYHPPAQPRRLDKAFFPSWETQTSIELAHTDSVLACQVLEGSRRALARAISRVEDDALGSSLLLSTLYRHTGRAHVVGVTGSPGTGKSTLVAALARLYRSGGRTVGIVAIDPTSPFSGGALLGDRVRMRELAGDPGIFVRSMATRGSLGGLAHATSDAITLLDAAGFDRILVETVGIGQTEVDVAGAAHTVVVVEAPGMGDDIQALKAGVLEIADVFAVNKADREGADRTATALQMMQGLVARPNTSRLHIEAGGGVSGSGRQPDVGNVLPREAWLPPIIKTVATRGDGVGALREGIERHAAYLRETGHFERRELARAAATLDRIVRNRLMTELRSELPAGQWDDLVQAVARRDLDPYTAAGQITSSGRPQAFGSAGTNRQGVHPVGATEGP